ncbi:hypothetical protein J1TS5_25850 [Paenibacillus macerans]|uniref:hypothetical protein n=1 Tax=Paenibacillus macerans TaxID=44252 RepID=UPI001B28BF38|nr:hypothetical protein [Paenibacillus macerans]GIP10415.1 hypothetical protein J1TS5_25850 [Paenibacillus macerans]
MIKKRICPECEGVGKKVDYFELPVDPIEREYGNKEVVIRKRPQRSDGRKYIDELCPVCKGE